MSAAVTKVNGCVKISDGLPNLDIYFILYKYYTIKFFKNQTRGGRRHMMHWTGTFRETGEKGIDFKHLRKNCI